MFYLQAIGAALALLWTWALDTEEAPSEPPKDEPPKDAAPFKAFASKQEHDDYIEGVLQERLTRKDKKLAEEKAETERLAREAALKEQEDWKKLAEERSETLSEREKRIGELETAVEERDTLRSRTEALEERLKGVMKPRLETVPELFRPFVESMTVEEQAKWLEENEDKMAPVEQRPRGSRPTGAPARDKGSDDEAAKSAREGQRHVSRI